MELNQNEIEELKKIVNNTFLLDLCAENRKRDTIDARRVYSKILRDRGFTFEFIARSLNKNHASIIHYLKNLDSLLQQDKPLRDKYAFCRINFLKDKDPFENFSKKDRDFYMSIAKLTSEVEQAVNLKNKILDDFLEHIENYLNENGYLPTIFEYKNKIIPLLKAKT